MYFGPGRTLIYVEVEEMLIYQNTSNVSRVGVRRDLVKVLRV